MRTTIPSMQSQFLNALLKLLEDHADEQWNLDRLAQRTGYSKYHLCRAFHAATQEPLQTYLRRLRLSKAADALKRGERVVDIALDCGYQSQEAFHRAFRKMFGITPRHFQVGEHHPSLLLKMPWKEQFMPLQSVPVRDATLDEFSLYGLGGHYSYDQINQIEALWERYSLNIETPIDTFGVTLPSQLDSGFHYYAATRTKVKSFANELSLLTIPRQHYKVFRYTGSASSMLRAFNYIWGVWLPEQKDVEVNGIDFEHYPEDYNPFDEKSWVDIYIPIVK